MGSRFLVGKKESGKMKEKRQGRMKRIKEKKNNLSAKFIASSQNRK
jgi:hypothetical protein